ncbi:hypothetical protein ACIPSJ_38855 [Streptomyces sp. NPDC090088]|uniref:hypothetical protein n=1 Tax=Streptomyces sp. NPDC090088 TaxID=3365944 RepID=UPI00381C1051
MSDTPAPPDFPDPDFLDRLLARHTAPRPAAARVRPRLPGPFERVEAVRAAEPAPASEAGGLSWPATAPAADTPRTAVPRPAAGTRTRTTHTERERTVVHTQQAAAPAEPVVRRPEVPLLRPAAPVMPEPRPVPDAGRRAAGRTAPARTATPVTLPPGPDVASDAVSAALRPSASDTAATRDAVRQAAARRPSRAAVEQVVQVQIGRLEVTATPAGEGQRRAPAKERAAAALSLTEYLTRRN